MKKTYITTMPNHIGAFLKASECFCELGINITRVSYNKAIDSHVLFIDAAGSAEQLLEADKRLAEIGYIGQEKKDKSVVLLEFRLRDVPGSVTKVLRLIDSFCFNISYISSQENGTDYQYFKMGLFVEDAERISEFIDEAEKLCEIRVIDYDHSEKVFDNSIFYSSFISGLSGTCELGEELRDELLINANLAMQTLDERGLSPYKTFDSISRFAEMLMRYTGEAFRPRITRSAVSDKTEIILIEPPCGSNTVIIKSDGELLFIDSGYAIYAEEMRKLIASLVPEFESTKKRIFVTHADVDHCGLLPMFDEILVSEKTAVSLRNEYDGADGYREENPLHKPYIRMCKILTRYERTDSGKLKVMWKSPEKFANPVEKTGTFAVGELNFEVFEGEGGHLRGETVLIDRKNRIAFTGDVYINVHSLTAEQAEYNRYAPILMTSVDTDPVLCAKERKAILSELSEGFTVYGSHGAPKNI